MFPTGPLLDVHLDGRRTAPADARRAMRELIGWSPPPEFADDALLLTSEIVTNAVTAAGQCRLQAWFHTEHGRLHVEVHDSDPTIPVAVGPRSATDECGRGLHIVDMVASHWGVKPDHDGKSVWFAIHC